MKFEWNPSLYDTKHDFVSKFGEDIVTLLNPQNEETILDLGCGTGDLTKNIAVKCKKIVGLDNSLEMVNAAKEKYPELTFLNADIKDFLLSYQFDAVFSNAALHWVPDAEKVLNNISKHLKIGGRFVAELGGKGCVNKIVTMVTALLDDYKINYPEIKDVLFYPSIAQYAKLLEQSGFEVNFAMLFDRPTVLKGGIDGLNNFIEMFFNWLFVNVSGSDKSKILEIVNDRLKSEMFRETGWVADYRRLRIVAVKMG